MPAKDENDPCADRAGNIRILLTHRPIIIWFDTTPIPLGGTWQSVADLSPAREEPEEHCGQKVQEFNGDEHPVWEVIAWRHPNGLGRLYPAYRRWGQTDKDWTRPDELSEDFVARKYDEAVARYAAEHGITDVGKLEVSRNFDYGRGNMAWK